MVNIGGQVHIVFLSRVRHEAYISIIKSNANESTQIHKKIKLIIKSIWKTNVAD